MAINRIDEELVHRGLADTIQQARLLVMEGKVYLGGGKVGNASQKMKTGLALTVRDGGPGYVSRGALKLKKALEVFSVHPEGLVCIDIGASTGGFTDVLLRAGARRVYAVDVGYGLLDWSLRNDPRVRVMEKTNARSLHPDMFEEKPALGVTDVSFISLRAILPKAFEVLGEEGRFIALVKPQFEARREQVGPGGIVRDPEVHRQVLLYVAEETNKLGWCCAGVSYSPITGTGGNMEFLMDMMPEGRAAQRMEASDFCRTVEEAWEAVARNE